MTLLWVIFIEEINTRRKTKTQTLQQVNPKLIQQTKILKIKKTRKITEIMV